MLIRKPPHFFREGFYRLSLLALCTSISLPANATIIEGNIKGSIYHVYIEGNRPTDPFFKHIDIGQPISADFWYEFDESNFPTTTSSDSYRGYDFGFSDMGITFHNGDQDFSPALSNRDLPLTQYRNLVEIARPALYGYFNLLAYTTHQQDAENFERLGATINFSPETLSYFNGFELVQNLSMVADQDSPLGSAEVVVFGSTADRFGIGQYYDATLFISFNEFTVGIREPASVAEPSPLPVIVIALIMLGLRKHLRRSIYITAG